MWVRCSKFPLLYTRFEESICRCSGIFTLRIARGEITIFDGATRARKNSEATDVESVPNFVPPVNGAANGHVQQAAGTSGSANHNNVVIFVDDMDAGQGSSDDDGMGIEYSCLVSCGLRLSSSPIRLHSSSPSFV